MPGGQVRGGERSELLLLLAKSGPSSAFGTFSPLAGRRRKKNLSPRAGRRGKKNLFPRAGRRESEAPWFRGEQEDTAVPLSPPAGRGCPKGR